MTNLSISWREKRKKKAEKERRDEIERGGKSQGFVKTGDACTLC